MALKKAIEDAKLKGKKLFKCAEQENGRRHEDVFAYYFLDSKQTQENSSCMTFAKK